MDDDRDLQLLRSFRADEAEPPAGMQARIEERLWQAILDEESAKAPTRGRVGRPRWYERWMRPMVAAGAAATLAIGVAVASDGGTGNGSLGSQAGVTQAGTSVLDATANSLFGGDASAASSPITGRVDLTDGDERLLDPPADHEDLAGSLPRDPELLLQAVRSSVAEAGISDPGDAMAFHAAMRWVGDPSVPVDLRAAMLRSLQGISGIDDALVGADVLGRDGIVVGQLDRSSGVRSQYVLDPADGHLLEARGFMTAYLDPACPPGTVTHHAAYDDDGEPIDPSTAQWVDWPQVVEACAPRVLVAG